MSMSLDLSLYGNDVVVWALALGVAVVVFVGLYAMRAAIARRVRSAARAQSAFATVGLGLFERTWLPIILVAALFAGSYFLVLPEALRRVTSLVIVLALAVQGAIWGSHVVKNLISYALSKDPAGASALNVLNIIARTAVWAVAVLLMLDNLGINVTALVAGLGISGIAVALAAQNILSDLFSSLSIVIDRPFEVGDFVIFDDYMGTVERIGLKTTRLRSLSGEQIVCSNSDLLSTRIRNYKRMAERRVLFTLGVVYGTTPDQLERIPRIIREAVEANPKTRFDRAHFKSYGDSSLDFETVYYVTDPDYNVYMDIQQAINLALYQRFEAEGVEFAFPTRTIFLHGGAIEQRSAPRRRSDRRSAAPSTERAE